MARGQNKCRYNDNDIVSGAVLYRTAFLCCPKISQDRQLSECQVHEERAENMHFDIWALKAQKMRGSHVWRQLEVMYHFNEV